MSIKIDLMPRYVAISRLFKRLLWAAGTFLVGTTVILGLITSRNANELAVTKINLANADAVAKKTEAAKAKQASVEAEAAPVASFVQFVVSTGQTGAQRAALVDLVGRYISPDAVISQIDMSDGKTAKITATLKTPDDYARFLLNLRAGSATRGGNLFAEDPKSYAVVPQNGLPGTGFSQFVRPLPTTQPQIVSYPITMTVVGTLKDPVVIPAEPGGAVAPAAVPGGSPDPRNSSPVRAPAESPTRPAADEPAADE